MNEFYIESLANDSTEVAFGLEDEYGELYMFHLHFIKSSFSEFITLLIFSDDFEQIQMKRFTYDESIRLQAISLDYQIKYLGSVHIVAQYDNGKYSIEVKKEE